MAKDKEEKEQSREEEELIDETAETADAEEETDNAKTEQTEAEALREQVETLKDRLARTAAEFDNYKKRTAKEKEELYAHGVCETVLQILPVLDNLQRAVAAADTSGGEDMLEGVKMIQRQFEEALKAIGVEEIEAVGSTFDPEIHNAVMHDENEEAEENTITEEFMKGYSYKGKVVRHSMVKVAN